MKINIEAAEHITDSLETQSRLIWCLSAAIACAEKYHTDGKSLEAELQLTTASMLAELLARMHEELDEFVHYLDK